MTFVGHFPRHFQKPFIQIFGYFTIVEARLEVNTLICFQGLGCVLYL